MSVKVMSWVMQHSASRLGDRLVLLAIADSASADGGEAWPSVTELARKAGMSERNVHRAVESLKALGELAVKRKLIGTRWRNSYVVLMEDSRSVPPDNPSPRPPDKSSGDNLSGDKSSPDRTSGVPLTNWQSPPDNLAHPPTPPHKEEPSRTVQEPWSARDAEAVAETTETLVGEFVDRCRKRPPKQFLGKLSHAARVLLEEGIEADDIRRGMRILLERGLDPSVLPSTVHQAVNQVTTGGKSRRQQETDDMFERAMERAKAREAGQ